MVLLCGCMAMTSCTSDDDGSEEEGVELTVGDKLPTFSVVMNDGETIASENLRGKVSVIVFFNTNCKDCRQELPVIQQIYDNYQELPLIAISRAEDAESIVRYWRDHGLTLPYSAQEDRSIYHLFAKSGIPRIYIVDEELTIRKVFTDNPLAGYDELAAAINAASL